MPIVKVSSKGQIVIPKEIRKQVVLKPGQKVFLRTVDAKRIEILVLPDNPIESFCGLLSEGSSLTDALMKERKEERSREEKKTARFFGHAGVSKEGQKLRKS